MPQLFIDLSKYQQFTAINLLSDPGHVGGKFIIPNGIEVLLSWTLEDGKVAHNVLFGSVLGTFVPTASIANNILQGLTTGTGWTGLAAVLATTTSLSGVSLRDRRAIDTPFIPSSVGGASGVMAGEALPNEVAAVLTLRTSKVGPGGRGRVYLPGFGVGATAAGNVISATAMTGLFGFNSLIPSVLLGQGITWGLGLPPRAAYVSPKTGVSHPARDAQILPITASGPRDNHWDSQRRRGLK